MIFPALVRSSDPSGLRECCNIKRPKSIEAGETIKSALIRKAVSLATIGVCVLVFGCKDSAIIWSAESRSPDGHWLVSASTEQFSGPGTAYVGTTVYLQQDSNPRVEILGLANDSAYPAGVTSVGMTWLTPSHLELTYEGHASLNFQLAKYAGIDISVRDLSKAKTVQ
jgi:hypothetical protein